MRWLSSFLAEKSPAAKRIGLIFQSEERLILSWLVVLAAGRMPCILQYPTAKMSRDYWEESIRHTVEICAIDTILHGGINTGRLENTLEIPAAIPLYAGGAQEPLVIESGSAIQLSSGTTGFRKGVMLSLEQLRRHTAMYNQVLKLSENDTIVSWLPLYHDMGFVACFVMPLLLKVPIVMIDPMAWIKQPELLYAAIGRYQGTVCFMPNFGFEVMSKFSPRGPLSSMRTWISCSEPAYKDSIQKFCEHSGTALSKVSVCYAMAENVFAVTQSRGISTRPINGREVVNCGEPIPETRVKIVDGEIFVKSPTSIQSYIGTAETVDSEGYYATGDLGELIDGELYVAGRKRDLLICAGKKYLLSDFDYALANVFPQSAGRIASLSCFDAELGTEMPLILVEDDKFWNKVPAQFYEQVKTALGLEAFQVHFVPRYFITKTSSGKINRKKTLEDWFLLSKPQQRRQLSSRADLGAYIASTLGNVPRHVPVREAVDSLGLVILDTMLSQDGHVLDKNKTLQQILDSLGSTAGAAGEQSVVRIVLLAEGDLQRWMDQAYADSLARLLGSKVVINQICVPPCPGLLSDLVFYDYFMPRVYNDDYLAFAACIEKIRNASVIVIDDRTAFLRSQCYCSLDHQFRNDPRSVLIGLRWARYTSKHHLLPRSIRPPETIEQQVAALADLQRYLGVPSDFDSCKGFSQANLG